MILEKKKDNILFIFILFIQLLLIFSFNHFTPWITDDYSFFENSSIIQILSGFKSFYLSWGGRFIGYFFAKLFLIFNKPLFDIINSLIYILNVFLIYKIIFKNEKLNYIKLLAVSVLMWFFVPAWGQDILWICGSSMYHIPLFLILLFIYPFAQNKLHNSFFSPLIFILGILATWTIENYAVAVVVFVLSDLIQTIFIKKEKLQGWKIFALAGTIIGSTLLIAAPGNYVRMSAFTDTRPFVVKLASRFVNITINTIETFHILIPVFIALVAYMIITKQYKKLITPGVYFISFLAAFYSMIMSPTFPDRAMLLGIVFFIISLLQLYNEVEKSINFKKLETIAVLSFSILVLPVSLYKAARNIYHFNAGWKQRIAYINEQKEQGNLNVTVPIIKLINPHVSGYDLIDLSKDPNDFPNPSIANYFGLESITGYEE